MKFYYMTDHSTGIKEVYAETFFGAYLGVKSWYSSTTTFVFWDENDNLRIFHGED